MTILDNQDVEEILFDRLTEKYGSYLAKKIFDEWPELIDEIVNEIVYRTDGLVDFGIKYLLRKVIQIRLLEKQNNLPNTENTKCHMLKRL